MILRASGTGEQPCTINPYEERSNKKIKKSDSSYNLLTANGLPEFLSTKNADGEHNGETAAPRKRKSYSEHQADDHDADAA